MRKEKGLLMKRTLLFIACMMLSVTCASCGGKKSHMTEAAVETTAEAVTTLVDDTTETTTDAVTEPETSAAPETTAPPEPETKPTEDDSKYTGHMDIARDFYDAYITHDAEAVYAMFSKEETEAFFKVIEPSLDGKAANEVFKKSVVIKAISDSMDAVKDIMASYADTDADKWSVLISEENIRDISEEDLAGFNDDYGTSFTSAVQCRYMYYQDDSNGQAFTGNVSSFLEKDGKWYLSFSQLVQSDLYKYIYLE